MKNYLFITMLTLMSGFYSAQSTVLLIADYDAAIGYHDNSPNNPNMNNYGNVIQNAAYTIPSSFGSGNNGNRALIHFDLSGIPQGATITSAKLNLYALGPSGTLQGHTGFNNSALLKRVLGSWTENTVTWNNQPMVTTQNEVILPASTNALEDYTNIDVTNLVIDMVASSNNGFMLQLVNEVASNALLFASIDCGDSNKFPTLEVSYTSDCLTLITDTDVSLGYHDNSPTNPNTNYGNAVQNAAYTIPSAFGSGYNGNRALIQFDYSSIPAGASITSAKLNLYALGPNGTLQGHTGTNNSALLQRVTGSWMENTVVWNTQPTTTSQNEVTLPASTNALQDYTNIDVTNLVVDMMANGNYGFSLKLVNEVATNALVFCSSDHADTLKHPSLIVCYTLKNDIDDFYDESNLFHVYPNPSSGFVNVNTNSITQGESAELEIYDIQGNLIKSINTLSQNTLLDLTDVESGVYFIRMVSGNKTSTEKIILSFDN